MSWHCFELRGNESKHLYGPFPDKASAEQWLVRVESNREDDGVVNYEYAVVRVREPNRAPA